MDIETYERKSFKEKMEHIREYLDPQKLLDGNEDENEVYEAFVDAFGELEWLDHADVHSYLHEIKEGRLYSTDTMTYSRGW